MSHIAPEIVTALGLQTTQASFFLTSLDQLTHRLELAPVAWCVRHAWNTLRLDGVLFVDNQPAAYLKQLGRAASAEAKERWVRFLWNHGTAPLLLIIEPTKIEVHSSMTRPPAARGATWTSSTLVDTWEIVAEALEQNSLADYLLQIETGQIYRDHREKFDSRNAVDRCLMENLRDVRDRLNFQDNEAAHNLLGRLLFISFLCDRGFLQARHFPGTAANLQEFFSLNRGRGRRAIDLLYDDLFGQLQREFNGSMFSPDMEPEKGHLSPAAFDLLADFLNGAEIASGQQTLPFWVYDFRFIPVETISAIYEDFLEAEDADEKHELGAYYTPRHLAEMVVNMAVLNGRDVGSWKFLDPACGSGVFLVISFNLLAEHWQFLQDNGRRHKATRINALLEILLNQIRGVDIKQTACRIAAFSLYLALFEKVQPVELEEFKESLRDEPILPDLLKPAPISRDGLATISQMDFIENQDKYPNDFDCVVGNPPWGARGSRQKAFPFVRDVPGKLRAGGAACLVLPTTMLVGEHGALTKDWFEGNTVDTIVNLADFQNQLFVGPDYPCFIMCYAGGKPAHGHFVRYLTPKAGNYDNRRGLISLEPGDEKQVAQREINASKDNEHFRLLWISRFHATGRDLKFLQRMWMMPQLGEITGKSGDPEAKTFFRGVGFKPFYPGETEDSSQPLPQAWKSDPYLHSDKELPLCITSEDCHGETVSSWLRKRVSRKKKTKASLRLLRRKPDERIFHAPLLIHNEGFTKFAFYGESGTPLRFEHALHAFTSAKADHRLIAVLTAFLQSPLANYLTSFSAAGWIAGRARIHFEEKLRLPFPLPDSPYAAPDAKRLADEIFKEFQKLAALRKRRGCLNAAEVQHTKELLDELILQYYGIGKNERILIDDFCAILAPSKRPTMNRAKGRALSSPREDEISAYQDTLCHSLNRFAARFGARRKILAEGSLKPDRASRLRLLVLRLEPNDPRKRATASRKAALAEREFTRILARMEQALVKESPPFQYLRGFKYLEEDDIFILKPDVLRHWTRTAALNDADEIVGYLAQLERSSQK